LNVPRSKTLSGDAGQVQALLRWAIGAGHPVTSVAVGSCRVELAPRAAEVPAPAPRAPQPDGVGIYGQFGGEVFEQTMKDAGAPDGLVPAIGRRA
jgi:hypothetical protein